MSFPNLKVSGNCQTECRQVIRQERGSNPSGLTHSVLLTYIFQYSLNELTDIHWFGKMGIHSAEDWEQFELEDVSDRNLPRVAFINQLCNIPGWIKGVSYYGYDLTAVRW